MKQTIPSVSRRVRLVAAIAAASLSASGCVGAGSDDQAASTTESSVSGDAATTEPGDADEPDNSSGATSTSAASADSGGSVPPAFWAIDELTLDLVLIETETGAVLSRTLGWGADLGAPVPEGGRQRLVEVEPAGDVIWVADCCEPAIGNVYGHQVGSIDPVPNSTLTAAGSAPTASPDALLVAAGVVDLGVAVFDASTGEQLIDPGPIGSLLAAPTSEGGQVLPRPLTWIDASTLAVGVASGGLTAVTFVSVENPAAPAAVGPTIEVEGSIADAAVRADGAVVFAVAEEGTDVVSGLVYDVSTGEQIAAFELPDLTDRIGYDPSGTFLLVSTSGGLVSWIGGGESSDLADTYLGVAWASASALPAEPDAAITMDIVDSQQIAEAGIDPPGGCSFYRNGATGETIFFSGIDGAFAVIDGEPQVFQSDDSQDLGPFNGDNFSASYRNVSDRVSSSIESSERSATLVISSNDGAAETAVDGIMWCGV